MNQILTDILPDFRRLLLSSKTSSCISSLVPSHVGDTLPGPQAKPVFPPQNEPAFWKRSLNSRHCLSVRSFTRCLCLLSQRHLPRCQGGSHEQHTESPSSPGSCAVFSFCGIFLNYAHLSLHGLPASSSV